MEKTPPHWIEGFNQENLYIQIGQLKETDNKDIELSNIAYPLPSPDRLKGMDLEKLGLIKGDKEPLDNGHYYRKFTLVKNDSEIEVCITYDNKRKPYDIIFYFNGEELQGRPVQIQDIQMLIELM